MSAAFRINAFTVPGDAQVWLDRTRRDGICLGQGATEEEALVQARIEIAHALEKVDQHIARLKHPNAAGRSAWEETEVSERSSE